MNANRFRGIKTIRMRAMPVQKTDFINRPQSLLLTFVILEKNEDIA
jgi:hypothetical protein